MGCKFKYQINHYLSILPAYLSIDRVQLYLEQHYQIPAGVFHTDRAIPLDNPAEIPLERLKIYAHVLNASVEQLTARQA